MILQTIYRDKFTNVTLGKNPDIVIVLRRRLSSKSFQYYGILCVLLSHAEKIR